MQEVQAITSTPLEVIPSLRRRTSKVLPWCSGSGFTLLTCSAAADASKASAKMKSEVPGKTKEAEKKGEAYAQAAGSKVDSAVCMTVPS